MDRVRTRSPSYVRQKSISSTASGGTPSSPMMSPINRHSRSGSTGVANFRKTQNNAAKAAAQRLAQVMAHQPADDDEDEDDDELSFDYRPSSAKASIGLSPARSMRPRSPAIGRNSVEQSPSASSVRSAPASRPALSVKTVPMVPPSVPISLKPPPSAIPPGETPRDSRRDKRMSLDMGSLNLRESRSATTLSSVTGPSSASALQDELDMLQEENEGILEKLRIAEDRFEEAEARSRQLEKQVASLAEGVSLEARLLTRKEAALQQREAALKAAAQNHDGKHGKIASLRSEAETARDEATSAMEQLQEAESEIKTLRTMNQRMMLTTEEMEEVVLKRCWLARYWSLCVRHGIHAEIAEYKHEFWSSLAPLPLEVVLSAGQKAKEENTTEIADAGERAKLPRDLNELSGDGNIESMLLVEKGLRELTSLKVEDAVVLAMAQHRRPNLTKYGQNGSDDEPAEGQNHVEAFELTQEESEDVLFKQAWITYFWRRAKNHGLEQDIVDERLQFWINNSSRTPTSHDAVDVERGLLELRKLGIENRLWEASRSWIDPDRANTNTDPDF